MTDRQLQEQVEEAIEFDPSVDGTKVGITVNQGVVTLRGDVASFAEKASAERVSLRLYGVRALANDLMVRLGQGLERTDSEIALAAADALKWNSQVPASRITTTVSNGWISAEGGGGLELSTRSGRPRGGVVDRRSRRDEHHRRSPARERLGCPIEDRSGHQAERRGRRSPHRGRRDGRQGDADGQRPVLVRTRGGQACRVVGARSQRSGRQDRHCSLKQPQRPNAPASPPPAHSDCPRVASAQGRIGCGFCVRHTVPSTPLDEEILLAVGAAAASAQSGSRIRDTREPALILKSWQIDVRETSTSQGSSGTSPELSDKGKVASLKDGRRK